MRVTWRWPDGSRFRWRRSMHGWRQPRERPGWNSWGEARSRKEQTDFLLALRGHPDAARRQDRRDFEAHAELARPVEAWLDSEAAAGHNRTIVGELDAVQIRSYAVDVIHPQAVAGAVHDPIGHAGGGDDVARRSVCLAAGDGPPGAHRLVDGGDGGVARGAHGREGLPECCRRGITGKRHPGAVGIWRSL